MVFCSHTHVLCNQKGINGSSKKGQKIVISRLCIALVAPFVEAVEIGAKGQSNRCLLHHLLIKMVSAKFFALFGIFGYNYTVYLHIAGGGGTEASVQYVFEDIFINGIR